MKSHSYHRIAIGLGLAGVLTGTALLNPDVAQADAAVPITPDITTAESSQLQDATLDNDDADEAPAEVAPEPAVFSDAAVDPIEMPALEETEVPPAVEATTEGLAVDNTAPSVEAATPELQTGIQILTPTAETLLEVPALTVVVQFPVNQEVQLLVNGTAVDPALIGRTETDSSTNQVTQTWYGVTLNNGRNTLTAQIVSNGTVESATTVDVLVRGAATQLTVETVEARIPADGRSTATVQGQLLDENGNRSSRNAIITLEASTGEFIGADYAPDQPGFQVETQAGAYTATLRSSLNGQVVRIRAIANDLEAFTQMEFTTALRPSLVSGVIDVRLGARGTDYFGSFRDFLPPDQDNSTQLDVRGAAFATGRIGEWLFTGAYNSSRPLNQDCNGTNTLFRTGQTCDRTYPVYGDDSTADVVAPSTDSLYLRLERTSPVAGAGTDYAMWGDYSTEEFAGRSQLFTATTRQLHGFKTNYNLGDLSFTGFYGNNVGGFQRDTVAPDGTSGFYFLSRRLLVPGSENVFIELEEFNRPGTVLQRESLRRGLDYEIDYDRGTLLFRRPILRTDVDAEGRTLVRRIVTTYQYESREDANIYGGRVQYNLSRELNRESWLGATYLQENQGDRDFELYGADALISFGRDGQMIAEYAHSNNNADLVGAVSGSAYRIEAQSTLFAGVQGRAYWRSTDPGFANNATTSFVPGQTRYGAELQARVSSTTTARFQYDHEDNFGVAPRSLDTIGDLINPGSSPVPGSRVDNSLTTISAGIQQQIGDATLGVDWIHRDREDRLAPNALTSTSDQLRTSFTMPLSSTLTFRALNELSLSSGSDPLYPDRTLLGLDWQAYPGITVSLNQQFFSDAEFDTRSITSLDVNGQYQLGSDTTLTGRFSMINAQEMAGAVGIRQGWAIAPGLRATFAYEHIFGSSFTPTAAGPQFSQPYAVGQGASALGVQGGNSFSVGLDYTDNPNFQANARFEHRNSPSGSNTVIAASALGRITPSLTALANFQQASASNQGLEGLGTTSNLRLGLAYRDPQDDRFNALFRYEYRRNPALIPDTILFDSGTGSEDHVLALEAIYAPNWQWEFYGKLALRHSTSYLASDLVGSSTVSLAQLRATHRFAYRWDVSAEGRWIGQPTAGYSELGLNLEAGYYLTPNLRLAAGYSLGAVSDRDFNGSRSASGPYLGLTIKLDNNLLRDFGFGNDPAPPQQQESIVTPVAASDSGAFAPIAIPASQP